MLKQLTGIAMAAETVRQHSEGVGAELEPAQQAAIAQVEQTQEAAEPVEAAPGLLVVEADGVMVRYRSGWHEVKLGLIGGHRDGRAGALTYGAARESAAVFGRRLVCEAARRGALEVVAWEGPITGRGLAVLRKVVVLGDGAHWIWTLAADHFGERIEIGDYYHASEHVWAVANAVYGQGSSAAKAWAEARRGELYEQGAVASGDQALGRLRPATAEARDVVRREQGYFRSNRERMAYPQFREQGLPIGSGAVESGAKHVVQLRMSPKATRRGEKRPRALVGCWGATSGGGAGAPLLWALTATHQHQRDPRCLKITTLTSHAPDHRQGRHSRWRGRRSMRRIKSGLSAATPPHI